jgi:precorrin-6B methylase 2
MTPTPRAVCLFLILCGLGILPAHAQFVRGPAGISHRAGNAAQRPAAVSAGARQSSPAVSAPLAAGQRLRAQSSVSASQIIISPGSSARTGRIRTIISAAPGQSLTLAPVHVNRRADFHRRHHDHGFPEFVIIEVPPFIGPSMATTEFIAGDGWSGTSLTENFSTDTGGRGPGQLAPFDPTPQEVVERMLALAAVKKNDVVYDLGSGDGRVVVAAAKTYGVRAVGFEIDPGLVKLARENARKQGVEKLVEIRQQDFMNADLSPATVVTLYLSYDGNLALRPKLMHELKPSARVVSYTFDMGDWQPKIAESYRDAGGDTHMLYLWQMAEPRLFSRDSRSTTVNAR